MGEITHPKGLPVERCLSRAALEWLPERQAAGPKTVDSVQIKLLQIKDLLDHLARVQTQALYTARCLKAAMTSS